MGSHADEKTRLLDREHEKTRRSGPRARKNSTIWPMSTRNLVGGLFKLEFFRLTWPPCNTSLPVTTVWSKKLVQTNGAPSKKLVSENRLTRPLSNKLLSQDVEDLASWGSFAFRFFLFVLFLFSFCVLATFGLRVSGDSLGSHADEKTRLIDREHEKTRRSGP